MLAETSVVILSGERALLDKYMDALVGHYEKESKRYEPAGFPEELRPVAVRILELIREEVAEYRKGKRASDKR